MKYFEVYEVRTTGGLQETPVNFDGSWAGETTKLEDEESVLLYYRVEEYDEDGTGRNIVYYYVDRENELDNSDEVLQRIREEHAPEDGWQNNNW